MGFKDWASGIGGFMVGGLTGAASVLLSSQGAKEQAKALREAGKIQEAIQMEQLALYKSLLEEGKPLREAYQQAALANLPLQQKAYQQSLELIGKDVLRTPGTGELFRRGLQTGTNTVTANLSRYGIDPSSGVGQRALAELSGGLLASDIQNIRNARFQLLGGNKPTAVNTLSTAVGLLGQAGNTAANRANLIAQEGAVKGGFYGSLGQDVANIGLLAGQGAFG